MRSPEVSTFKNEKSPMKRKSAIRPLVICGPSGVGKGTLIDKIIKDFDLFEFSVSHTTRTRREREIEGIHYHYVNRDTMNKLIEEKKFIEHITYDGNVYGTSFEALEKVYEKNKIPLLDISTEAVKNVKKNTDLNPILVFVKPPTFEELQKRLQGRDNDPHAIKRRLKLAEEEIAYGESPREFHYVLENDDVDKAFEKLKTFVQPFVEEFKAAMKKRAINTDDCKSVTTNGCCQSNVDEKSIPENNNESCSDDPIDVETNNIDTRLRNLNLLSF